MDRFNADERKRTKDTKITLATRNVQTMLKLGRMNEIMEEIGRARVDSGCAGNSLARTRKN